MGWLKSSAVTILLAASASAASADPPAIVARVSFLSGTVSYRASSAVDWTPAVLNYPLTIGDTVWTDRPGRAELQLGTSTVRLAPATAFSVLNLDAHVAQIRLTAGSLAIGVHDLGEDDALEIDTPGGAVNVLRPGFYRVDVNEAGEATNVTVRHGEAEIASGGTAFTVRAGQSASVNRVDAPGYAVQAAGPIDDFESWALYRDRREENPPAVRYVSRGMVGYADLDEYGTWRVVASYGPVWVPRVAAGWVPYRFGHWAWVEPWGWTWIDDAPWGFAPFHYGRWVEVGGGWAWVPGTIVARPVYAPALVAFVGGASFRVSAVAGEPVAWFPLGPREVYVPAYRVTPEYVRAINVAHVSVTNVNITNVTNVTYINRSVPGAVTAVSRETFVQAQPVAAAAVVVPANAVASAAVVGHAAPVSAPVRSAAGPRAAAPPSAVLNRQVTVRMPPPASTPVAVRAATAPRSAPRPAVSGPASTASTPTAVVPQAAPRPGAAPGADKNQDGLAARHAEQRAAMESRHQQERAAMIARQQQQEAQAKNDRQRENMRANHQRQIEALEARHRRERDSLQDRQERERQKHGG